MSFWSSFHNCFWWSSWCLHKVHLAIYVYKESTKLDLFRFLRGLEELHLPKLVKIFLFHQYILRSVSATRASPWMIETRWDQSLGEDERSSVWRTPMLSKTLRTLKTFSPGMLWRDFVWFGWVCFEVFFSNAEARNGKHGRLKSSYQGLISLTINLIITLINTSISLMIALIITLISAITTFIKILFHVFLLSAERQSVLLHLLSGLRAEHGESVGRLVSPNLFLDGEEEDWHPK